MALIPKLNGAEFRADLAGTIAFLRTRTDVKADALGVIGFCIGGHLAYLAAATNPDVKATASFYGGGVATFSPGDSTPTVNQSAGIKGRILCLFGGKDQMIPKPHVDAIRAALEAGHVRHEIVVYPDAGHAFFCDRPERGSFHAPSAADAWTRVKSLFAEELR
jgi:carboxymethylenebutenolidase